jgi:GNAT superfamily N-acetyltransferase
VLVRAVRDEDWEKCLGIDTAYETDYAWQMDEIHSGGEWRISFREIHLPRTLRIQPAISNDNLLKSWQYRDQFWVALEHREVIGYLGLAIDQVRYQARITDIVVTSEYRRMGTASAMLARATEWCLRQHIHQLILVCPLKAHPAISFAQKHHFAFCGFQDNYWQGQEVALFFRQRVR